MRIALSTILLLCAVLAMAQTATPKAKVVTQTTSGEDGARLFEVNCGRCHRPPDQLSPKITGTVLRHMRVRAMLSKEDQQAILKYLAP
jgi:mono/diheme cytochrome c family protein